MSLQVWLPLNGDLHNQGLTNIIMMNNGATVNNNGKIGKCYYFNGNSYLQTSSLSGVQSICFWVKLEKKNTLQVVFADYKSKLAFGFDADNQIIVSCANKRIEMYSDINFPNNVWTHIALVYNADNSDILLYINGILQTTRLATNYWVHKTDNLIIGARNNNSIASYINGYINDFRMYDHRLSAKEVEEISKGLILHYKLDDPYIEPTTNLLNSEKLNFSDWTINQQGTLSTNDTINGTKCLKWTATSASSSTPGLRTENKISFLANITYTFSALVQGQGDKTFRIYIPGTTQRVAQVYTEPTRISQTFSFTADTNTYIYILMQGCTANSYIKMTQPQLEIQDHATLYTIGDRNNNNIYDYSGYGNNGIIIGDTFELSSDSAKYSHSISLPNDNWIRVINRPTIVCSHDAITVNIWAKIATSWTYNKGALISCQENGGWAIGKNSSNILYFEIYADGAYRVAKAPDSTYLTSILNGWHMFTGTADNSTINFYIDGELIGTGENTATTDFSYYNNYIFIGGEAKSNNTIPYSAINGLFGDTRIYATALTSHQIKELYQTSTTIDKNGNIYAREYIENNTNININKNGQLQSNKIVDSNDITIANFKKSDKSINSNIIYEY